MCHLKNVYRTRNTCRPAGREKRRLKIPLVGNRWRGEEDRPGRDDDRRRTLCARPADAGRAPVPVVRLGQGNRPAADRARDRHHEQRGPPQVVPVARQAQPQDYRPVRRRRRHRVAGRAADPGVQVR